MSEKKIRTRFAPSPTGFLHVGSLRTALYAYIIAKKNQGDFIVRIEDTDQSRQVEGAVENLLNSLKWAGLTPDEGVLLDFEGKVVEKGDFGPYTQSQRLDIYQKYAQKLVDDGLAYKCFCSGERLDDLRKKQQQLKLPTKYDGLCRQLSPDEVAGKEASGEKFVIRLKVPENQEVSFTDLVRGEVKINTNDVDDQVILKSDGFPTYHLASVVDDHEMEINFVIRGEEWLPSTPKHLLLYSFLNWQPPQFAHLPLLLNADKTKLSKRQGDVAVEDYRQAGYLPEALVNFVALLGWNPGTEQEVFSLAELIDAFDFKQVNKAGAVFDINKLDWMNGEYIKKLNLAEFKAMSLPFISDELKNLPTDSQDLILKMEQDRISKLSEIGQGLSFLLVEKIDYNPQILIWKKSNQANTIKNLQLLLKALEAYGEDDWQALKLETNIKQLIADNNLGNGDVLWPMRVALTGQEKSPPPFEVAEILGKTTTMKRLTSAIELLK